MNYDYLMLLPIIQFLFMFWAARGRVSLSWQMNVAHMVTLAALLVIEASHSSTLLYIGIPPTFAYLFVRFVRLTRAKKNIG
jgi:hypothetical protein